MKKLLLVGVLACVLASSGHARDGAPPSRSEKAVRNQQGMTHFKQGYYDLIPKGRQAEADAQLDLAEESFKKAIEIDGDFVDAHRNLARLYDLQRKFGQAATEYAHAIRLDPKDIDTYVHMALVQTELGDFDEAVRYLETARTQTDDERVIQQLDRYIAKAEQAGQTQ